jgi:hypothetical protein
MPSTINLYQIGVWFCVGFFTGAGLGDCRLARRSNLAVLKRPGREAKRHPVMPTTFVIVVN